MGDRAEIHNLENHDLIVADFLLASVAQLDHMQEILDKFAWDSLAAFWREGLARARGRIGHKPRNLIGHQDFIILSNKSKLARFTMIAVGDIVLVTYRLAGVLAVGPDDQGVVRTVIVTVGQAPTCLGPEEEELHPQAPGQVCLLCPQAGGPPCCGGAAPPTCPLPPPACLPWQPEGPGLFSTRRAG